MKRLLAIPLLIMFQNSVAQDCDCFSQFEFIKNYFETNSPAFQKIKSNKAAYKQYMGQVRILALEIKKEKSTDRCNLYFEKYVRQLKDHHSGVDINLRRLAINLNSSQAIDSFKATAAYKSFRKVRIDTALLFSKLKSKAMDAIEGIYTTGRITIALYRSKPGFYTGVVIRKHPLLDIGHVLVEFKKRSKDSFDCVYHTGLLALNFQNVYKTLEIKNGQIPYIGFSKLGLADHMSSKPYDFKIVGDSINYLKLASFNHQLKEELDSFYTAIDAVVQARPYLIIDLRDNGGGSEACYYGLVKYFYTRPLRQDRVDVWVTADNIKRYEEINYNMALVSRMKQTPPGSFIAQIEGNNQDWVMERTTNPKKIVVLYNKSTASAAEGMVTYCMQSDKVITMGQNSGGYIGYGDVMTTAVPCGNYSIRCTTTRYHNNSRFEFVGIAPMYSLTEKEDWIQAAESMLLNQH